MHPRTKLFSTIASVLMTAALAAPAAHADAYGQAQNRVDDAAHLINHMQQDPNLAQLLSEARGVFIVPHYGKAGFIVGAQGGDGVVLARHDGRWTDPAFFNIGGGSIGWQAGASGGSIVMILMTQRAVDRFEHSRGKWSLHAGVDLTVVRYSGNAQLSTRAPRSDIVAWTDTRGLYGGLTAGVTDITPENHLDHAYYHGDATPRTILTGMVRNHQANDLRDALGTRVAER